MLIKPKYSPGDKAPMKWCTWQMFMWPIGMFFSLAEFLSKTSDYIKWLQSEGFPAYGVFVLILNSAIVIGGCILILFAANGLGRMEWRGPRCIYALFFYSAAVSILSGVLGWLTFPEVLGGCLGSLIVFIPHYIYYQKRRNLFTPLPVQREPAPAPAQPIVETPQPSSPPPEPVSPPAPEDTGEQMVLPEFTPPATEPPQKKRFSFKLLSVLLAVVCAASLAGNAVLTSQLASQSSKANETIQGLKEKVKKYDEKNTEQVKTINSLRGELYTAQSEAKDNGWAEFLLSENIGFLYNDDPNFYHRYNCKKYVFIEHRTYGAHNTEFCEHLGFTPCPFCY